MDIHAYAALSPGSLLSPFSYTAPPLQPFEVLIQVSHSGICRTDLHMIDNAWNRSSYPLVPGHEIVGTVVQAGSKSSHQVGVRVAVGWVRSACLACEECMGGHTNICLSKTSIYNHGRYGGFADHVVADSRFCFALPDGLSSVDAAPLLCAGATVFAPLLRYKIQKHHTVGVIGIGGLGHLALQFCKAMKATVSAISSSPDKEEESKSFGATAFYTLPDNLPAPMQFHFLLCTVDVALPWNEILSWLKPNGVLCLVSRPPKESFQFDPSLLISTQRTLAGSNNANRETICQMLEFATQHRIRPKVEVFALSEMNQAITRLRNNEVRYRVVLKIK